MESGSLPRKQLHHSQRREGDELGRGWEGAAAEAEAKATGQGQARGKDDQEVSSSGTQKGNDLHRDQENLEELGKKI